MEMHERKCTFCALLSSQYYEYIILETVVIFWGLNCSFQLALKRLTGTYLPTFHGQSTPIEVECRFSVVSGYLQCSTERRLLGVFSAGIYLGSKKCPPNNGP